MRLQRWTTDTQTAPAWAGQLPSAPVSSLMGTFPRGLLRPGPLFIFRKHPEPAQGSVLGHRSLLLSLYLQTSCLWNHLEPSPVPPSPLSCPHPSSGKQTATQNLGWEASCHTPVPSEDVSLDVALSGSLLPLPWSAQVPSQASPSPTGAHPLGAVPSLVLHTEDQLSPGAPCQVEFGGPGQALGITECFYGDVLLAPAAEESRGQATPWFPQLVQALEGPGCLVLQQALHVCVPTLLPVAVSPARGG